MCDHFSSSSGTLFLFLFASLHVYADIPTPWTDTESARVTAHADLVAMNAALLDNPSASLVLQAWCGTHDMARPAELVAELNGKDNIPPTSAIREVLHVGLQDTVNYRRVRLSCGTHVLSEAENWYVPSRLTSKMNDELKHTDIPFGIVVRDLHFYRERLSEKQLWFPLVAPPGTGRVLDIPNHVLRHEAVLKKADGQAFSYVIENYTKGLFDFVLPDAVHEDSRLAAIIKRGTLRVGTTGDYPPYTLHNPASGQYEGLDIDMAHLLAASLGVKLIFVRTTWSKLTTDLISGRFDIAMGGISITEERKKMAAFSGPSWQDGKTPIARCQHTQQYGSIAQIDQPNARLIVKFGSSDERLSRTHFSRAQLTVWPDNTTVFTRILDGHADVIMTDTSEALYQQKQQPGVLCTIQPENLFNRFDKAYLMPRDALWNGWVNAWLSLALGDGSFKQRQQRWLGK